MPEATFGVGHGQMDEEVLEQVILVFVRKEFDVLVSTTIIESGIDIANVNTIVIDNADTLGLTQLYQLRGRVGRSTQRAYAYLVYRPKSHSAWKRRNGSKRFRKRRSSAPDCRSPCGTWKSAAPATFWAPSKAATSEPIGYDLYIRLLARPWRRSNGASRSTEQR